MKIVKELCIIMGITFLGEIMSAWIPLQVPASIYGMLILLFALCTKMLKLEQIEKSADTLLDAMPVLFVPAGVGLMNRIDELRKYLTPIAAVIFLTTVVVMAVTGKTAQFMLRNRKGNKENAGYRL